MSEPSHHDLHGKNMRNFKPAGALFDLDGVLIDTEGIYTNIRSDIESHFPTGIENFAYVIKGNTLPRILNTYFRSEDHEAIKQMLHQREEAMDYPIFPGVMELLYRLTVAGIPKAIVTSSGDEKMRRIARMHPEFMACFDALITDSNVQHSKPHPEPYLKGAEALGADCHDCIVFEDSYSGLQSGRDAGAKLVAIATTNPHESLIDKADIVVDSISELLDLKSFFKDWEN